MAIEEAWNGESDCYNTIRDVLNDFMPREKPYTDKEENRVKRIIKAYKAVDQVEGDIHGALRDRDADGAFSG